MTKIVNPILIYLAGIVGGLKRWLITLSILALLVACASFIYYMFKVDSNYYGADIAITNNDDKKRKKSMGGKKQSGV